MSKLKLRAVAKAYGATVALRHGDFDLRAGEVHVLIGSNGSGKSTLCKIVAGSVRPDSGEVSIDGAPVTVAGPQAAKALGIGIFYQELSLSPRRSVAENICLPDLPLRIGLFVDRAALMRRAATYVALFEGVSGEGFSADATIDGLRPDQRQLVEIMKTLATEAPILIFDEPTSALDRAQVERFFAILRRLKAEGRAVVFISHRMDEIFEIGDRVTVIRDGTTIGTSDLSQTDPAGVVRQMVGDREELAAAAAPAQPAAATGKPRLEARALSGRGFSDVSFELRGGEILGLGGLHGQGQSAVLRALFGGGRAVGGSAALAGVPYAPRSPRDAIRAGVAYVSGDRGREGVVQGRSILENLMPVHYLRRRLALAMPAASRAAAGPAVQALKTRFAGYAHPIGSLSGGNQQKIVIARWLIDRPDVLLLDDPTKGIDLSAKGDLFALIRQLAAEGMAIVLYSSEDAELLAHSDRILVFNGGRVTRELTGGARTRHDLTQAAYEAA